MCIETNVGWSKRSVPNIAAVRWARCALPNLRKTLHLQQGVSLIEAVLFIVVVSVALVVVLKTFDIANQGSVDPLIRRQALAIAQAMLDEISAKPFGSAATDVTADGYTAGPVNSATRANADDIDDYDGYDQTGITTLSNAPLTGLENYQVHVDVDPITSGELGTVPVADAFRITVTVTAPSGEQFVLAGYRANY
jgi:MSHA pilin protein MshD